MIGLRIREYRAKKGWKVKELSDIIGISQGSLSDIENARTNPSSDTIIALVEHTDIHPAWLLTGEGPMIGREESFKIAEECTPYEIKREEEVDPDLSLLLIKMKAIYRKGNFDERARMRGTIDLIFEDIKKRERDSLDDEGEGLAHTG